MAAPGGSDDGAYYAYDYDPYAQGYDTDQAEYAAAYWRLDAEAREVMLALAPERAGESVPLGEMAELCRRMQRPLRDEGEQLRLMTAFDSTNQMQILRHDLCAWLLSDMLTERALANERLGMAPTRAKAARPPAQPCWEEIVELSPSMGVGMPPTESTYYYNTLTGESSWELPRFIQSLRAYCSAQATKRALRVVLPADGTPIFLLTPPDGDDASKYKQFSDLEELRELFDKCDDNASGALDVAEFQDLCVVVSQPLNGRDGVTALMLEVDPFDGEQGVSWDALSRYWVANSPFQRRSRLDPPGATFEAWEQIESLHQSDTAVVYRHATTLRERRNHPDMEQRVADMLTTLFPSSKLNWGKKIELFLDVQWQMQQRQDGQGQQPGATEVAVPAAPSSAPSNGRNWNLRTCWRILTQLHHPMARRGHVEAALQQLRDRFGSTTSGSGQPLVLDEAAVRGWLQHCVEKVEQRGWEQLVDPDSGQVYYCHETSGATQWDPPNLAAQMADMLGLASSSTFGGLDAQGRKLTPTERIARLFRLYDTDESGAITLDEFRPFYRALVGRGGGSSAVISANDDSVSESQLQNLFSMLDTSGDGEVTLEEFQLWWLTKFELEEDETEAVKLEKKRAQQRELCRSYLENAGAAIVMDKGESTGASDAGVSSELSTARTHHRIGFESNMLPRLAALLGPFQLKGLVHRSALSELVTDFNQQVDLVAFLEWYERFELAEMERRALEEAKAKARAELVAQQQKEIAAAKEKRRKMKQKRQLAAPAKPMGVEDTAAVREQKITALFKAFDTNGSGFLDERELQQLTKALGHDMNSQQLREMMRIIDVNGDGQVSLGEFITFWNAFQPAHGATTSSTGSKQAKPKEQSGVTAAVSPATNQQASQHHRASATFTDMNASLEVALELAKDRALKVCLGDFADVLGEWKADFLARSKNKANALARLEQEREEQCKLEELRRQRRAFKPTRTRKYGAFRLDVSWIEPEVVECVSDIIRAIGAQTRPQLVPDAAQTIQALARGYVTRVWMSEMIQRRFAVHIDPSTLFYYYIDTHTLKMHLERPLYRTHMASVKPFDLEDCASKVTLHQFRKKMAEMKRKAAFYDRNFRCGVTDPPCQPSPPSLSPLTPTTSPYRPLLAPSAMFLFDVAECVHKRLLSNIWIPLREEESVLVELIAQRHPRQLRQRSSDSARNLPLHHMVRHGDTFPLRTIRAAVRGYPDALTQPDAFRMTPLHIALREWRSHRQDRLALLNLLVPSSGTAQLAGKQLGSGGQPRSIWEYPSACGDTPLHVAVRHRASISVLRWLLERCQRGDRALDVVIAKNNRGESAFHMSVDQFADSTDQTYAKTVILLFCKHFDPPALCARPTRRGDVPLHLALDAIERLKQPKQATSENQQPPLVEAEGSHPIEHSDNNSSMCWLIRELVRHYPAALAVRKPSNGLLPIHLAIKYGLPPALLCELLHGTARQLHQHSPPRDATRKSLLLSHEQRNQRNPDSDSLLQATTIRATNMTLVHYALMHQPHAVEFTMKLIDLMPGACFVQTVPGSDLPLHIAAGVQLHQHQTCPQANADENNRQDERDDSKHAGLVRRLCELHPKGCETYNAARELPLHVAITRGNSAHTVQILLELSSSALGDDRERRGLRALVMAASARVPDYRVLLALLDVTPSHPVMAASTAKSKTQRGSKNVSVTPLYALSMRECSSKIIEHGIPNTLHEKYERIDDEDAYYLEMAKSKLRHRHHCPSDKWTFEKILALMEHNPLDEAVMQRALYTINAKLLAINAPRAKSPDPRASPSKTRQLRDGAANQSDGDAVILDTITLNPDLMLVRTVHQAMYEFPQNLRLQIIGKSVLDKLLPTAYAKAAYKAKVDPYFNL